MKKIAQLTAGSILLMAFLVSCGNPLDGSMWVKEYSDDDGDGYWINFYEEEETKEPMFDFIILEDEYQIGTFFNGSYEVDSKAKTVTLTADRVTDGAPDPDDSFAYSWDDTVDWEVTLTYSTEGDNLILENTEEDLKITLAPPEQPVEIQRALRSAE